MSQELKPAVQKIMDLARHFRAAPGDLYDSAYTALQNEVYAALTAPAKEQAEPVADVWFCIPDIFREGLSPHIPGELAHAVYRLAEAYRSGDTQPEPLGLCGGDAAEAELVADRAELLAVIGSLGAALKRLSFCAQTTGGVGGPDSDLTEAIGVAEKALSLAGISRAMDSATCWGEAVPTLDEIKRDRTCNEHEAAWFRLGFKAALREPVAETPGWRLVPEQPTYAMLRTVRNCDPLGVDIEDKDLESVYGNIWKGVLIAAHNIHQPSEKK